MKIRTHTIIGLLVCEYMFKFVCVCVLDLLSNFLSTEFSVIEQWTQDTSGLYSCVGLSEANKIIGTTTEEVVLNANQDSNNWVLKCHESSYISAITVAAILPEKTSVDYSTHTTLKRDNQVKLTYLSCLKA